MTRTPSLPARIARRASPMNRPCSTTPGIFGKALRQAAARRDHSKSGVENEVSLIRDENMAVRFVRNRTGPGHPASDTTAAIAFLVARGQINNSWEVESGQAAHTLLSSAITTMSREAVATIFSRNSAPPRL